MTRQYKSTEEELDHHYTSLQRRMDENEESIIKLRAQKEQIQKTKNDEEARKDDEIKSLNE